MNAQELLTTRQSTPLLSEPAPNKGQLDFLLEAAMRAPDHGGLTPWNFTVIQDQGLSTLSEIFTSAAEIANKPEALIEKAQKMPFRAPLIIMVSTRYQSHNKVPESEQLIAAGCCAHAIQMAAFSLGYGAIWRSGDFCFDDYVKKQLNVNVSDDIVGFIYIGTITKEEKLKPPKDYISHVSYL